MDYSKEIKRLNKIIRDSVISLILYTALVVVFIGLFIIFTVTKDSFYGIMSILIFLQIESREKTINKNTNDIENINIKK